MELIDFKSKHHCCFVGPKNSTFDFPENYLSIADIEEGTIKKSFLIIHGNSEDILEQLQLSAKLRVAEFSIIVLNTSYNDLREFKKSYPYVECLFVSVNEAKQELKARILGKIEYCRQNALNWFIHNHKNTLNTFGIHFRALERVRLTHALCMELKVINEDYLYTLELAFQWENTNDKSNFTKDLLRIVETADAALVSTDAASFKNKVRGITSSLPFTEKSKFNSAVESVFSALWRIPTNAA